MCSLIQSHDWLGAEALLHHWMPRSDDSHAFRRLAGMMKRGQQIQHGSSFAPQAIRSWHFILTGGLLLCADPAGDESQPGNQTLYRQGLLRLQRLLNVWQLRMPRVLMLPDPCNKTLARSVAQALDCPLEPWTPTTRLAGLIPVKDLGQLTEPQRQALSQHHPGQMLWSQRHNLNAPFVADLTTMFCRSKSGGSEVYHSAQPTSRNGFEERAMSCSKDPQTDQAELVALAQQIRPGEHGAAALKNWGSRLLSPIAWPRASSSHC